MTPDDIFAARVRVAKLGLHICFTLPLGLFVLALLARAKLPFLASPIATDDNAKIVGYAFIAVAVIDAVSGFILKRRLINAATLMSRFSFHPNSFSRQLAVAFVPIFIVCAMPAIYGIIFYFLGGDLDTYVLISIISPAAFLLLKPKEEELERLANEIFKPSDDADIRL